MKYFLPALVVLILVLLLIMFVPSSVKTLSGGGAPACPMAKKEITGLDI